MKRSVSILLVALVLMNVMGYYGLLVGLQYRNQETWTKRLASGDYDQQDLRSVKVWSPGNPGSPEYDDVSGEFIQEGKIFRLVKQRVYKDTFHIVFIKDETGTLIRHALSDFAKSFSDKSSDDEQHLIILPLFIRDYIPSNKLVGVNKQEGQDIDLNSSAKIFLDNYYPNIVHPPQIV